MGDGAWFCTRCGAILQEDYVFCPECGSPVGDAEAHAACSAASADAGRSRLTLIAAMCIIWGLIALYFGISILTNLDTMVDAVMDSGIFEEVGMLVTEAEVGETMRMLAYITLAGAAAAMVAGVLCGIRREYGIAVLACVIASILGLVLFVGVIGFAVAYMISRSKAAFTD